MMINKIVTYFENVKIDSISPPYNKMVETRAKIMDKILKDGNTYYLIKDMKTDKVSHISATSIIKILEYE